MKKLSAILLTALVIIAGCKKDDEQEPAATNEVTVNSTPQVNFKLDGVAKSYVQGSGYDPYTGVSQNQVPLPDSSHSWWWSYLSSSITGDPVFELDKGHLYYLGSSPDSNAFYNFFTPGSFNYVQDPEQAHGVNITCYISGVDWSTSQGTGDQTGSSFTIISRKKQWSQINGVLYVTILANFNCKVYDGIGNSKTITDGVFVGSFGNIQ